MTKSSISITRCRPGEAMSRPASLVGWLLRCALVGFLTYAFLLFFADASGIVVLDARPEEAMVSEWPLFAVSTITALVGAGLMYSPLTALITLVLAGGAGAWWLVPRFSTLYDAGYCLVNTIFTNLNDAGYNIPAAWEFVEYGGKTIPYLTTAYCVVGAVLGLILSLLILRTVHPVGVGILTALWLIPVYTYNVTRTTTGTMLVIAGMCGVVALWLYDRTFGPVSEKRLAKAERRQQKQARKAALRREKEARRRAASDAMIAVYDRGGDAREAKTARRAVMRAKSAVPPLPKAGKSKLSAAERRRDHGGGGYAAAGAVVVAMLALAFPASLIDENFPIIESLDSRIRIARLYATAYLMGDDLDLNSLSMYGGVSELNPREVSFESPRFRGEKIFTLYSGTPAPQYLRSWIGTGYDIETDTWLSAEKEDVDAYRWQFGATFSSDQIGTAFRSYVHPYTADPDKANLIRNYSEYGFVMTQVHLRREGGSGRIFFAPAQYHTDGGVMEFGSFEPNRYAITPYYDGVYSSRFFAIPGRAYSAYAYVTTMKDPNLGTTFASQIYYMKEAQKRFHFVDSVEPQSEDAERRYDSIVKEFEEQMTSMGVTWRGDSLLRQYVEMSDEERQAFHRYFSAEDTYRPYAYQTYANPFGSEAVTELAMQILADHGWYMVERTNPVWGNESTGFAGQIKDSEGRPILRDDVIRAVIDYLGSEDFTYTLTPTPVESAYDSNLETFLFETQEGYCVHFATAAAAILREYGLAVRYCEGYVASELQELRSSTATAKYTTSVYDFNAHAWIEVYYPYMGWVQYETTPAYMSAMYDPEEGYATSAPRPSYGEEEEEEIEDIPLPELPETRDYTVLIVVLCVGIAGAGLFFLVRFFVVRGQRFVTMRQRTVEEARDRDAYYSGARDNRALSRSLIAMTMKQYAALGHAPQTGELSEAYAIRLLESYGELSTVSHTAFLALAAKEEFGHGLSYEEMNLLAAYLEQSSRTVWDGLRWYDRIRLRYIRRAI